MVSMIAQVEPLPLVPPTVITGHVNFSSSASRTWLMRVKPMSMPTGCADSRWVSHASRVGKVNGEVAMDGVSGLGADAGWYFWGLWLGGRVLAVGVRGQVARFLR